MKKKLDAMTQKELREVWGADAKKFLVGRKIVDVYYHNKKQNDEIFYDDCNGSGVIFTTAEKLPVIPSIHMGYNYEKE